MLYQIEREYLDEYINMKKCELGDEIVEHLSSMRDEVTDTYTKKYLQRFVDEYAEERKICKSCFMELDHIVATEKHNELDGYWCEEYVCGYICPGCGCKYSY